jgi:flagellar hook-length control protein FliK
MIPTGDIQQPNRQSWQVLPVNRQPVPVQQFAQTMQGLIVKQFSVSSANGIHEARISLFPEQLGQVDVRISLHNGQLTALFVTDTAAAKDALDNQMAQLRSALQVQGLHVDKLEVTQNQQSQQAFFQERQGQQGREHQPSRRNKAKDGADRGITAFDADLEKMAAGAALHRDLGLGRGIHTTV